MVGDRRASFRANGVIGVFKNAVSRSDFFDLFGSSEMHAKRPRRYTYGADFEAKLILAKGLTTAVLS
ncbi:MAG: hypothetical protein DHS20C15_03870 [Planctomycetota bacterium]|nr:MAG: hypothetical protein DHS20C15_03870 [Planctomycetota bacterium]